ncbi:hypothetical protein [Corallococcus sp. CA054B]|uniref:AbiJ-related protein n=1 Tax=Corallococcus sp. CA054B TaxID=2316734 RepID=UPI0011C3752E|nr:hypothetical protein [Corallococcus sp. CA054B]
MKIANQVLQDIPGGHYNLEEELWKRQEQSGRSRITEVTRRALLDELALRFDVQSIGGKIESVDLFARNWPLGTMLSFDPRYSNAVGDFSKHILYNDDWDIETVFSRLNLLHCSERRFLGFLEQLVHPRARDGDEQAALVVSLNVHLAIDGLELRESEQISGRPVFRIAPKRSGVSGRPKNIIFGANGPKPEIIFRDAVNNDVEIVRHAQYCLIYDEPIGPDGLAWKDLVNWWASAKSMEPNARTTAESLYRRLEASLASPPERVLFRAYFKEFVRNMQGRAPALIPQVYLHLDPFIRRTDPKFLARQRMDFLLLLSARDRIVIEVDGKQHYADEDRASPAKYAKMVAADRELQLAGYSIFRFGGAELDEVDGPARVTSFFRGLFERFGIQKAQLSRSR